MAQGWSRRCEWILFSGMMDDDKAFFFTAKGKNLSFGNGDQYQFSGTYITSTTTNRLNTATGSSVAAYSIEIVDYNTIRNLRPGATISSTGNLQDGTILIGSKRTGTGGATLYIDKRPIASPSPTTTLTFYASSSNTDLSKAIPLVSLRLAPCVDNGYIGREVGERDIINRMQVAPYRWIS